MLLFAFETVILTFLFHFSDLSDEDREHRLVVNYRVNERAIEHHTFSEYLRYRIDQCAGTNGVSPLRVVVTSLCDGFFSSLVVVVFGFRAVVVIGFAVVIGASVTVCPTVVIGTSVVTHAVVVTVGESVDGNRSVFCTLVTLVTIVLADVCSAVVFSMELSSEHPQTAESRTIVANVGSIRCFFFNSDYLLFCISYRICGELYEQ